MTNNSPIIMERQHIQEMIYTVRDKQVMLDSDLARLYQVETKVLNQAVKRNIQRFPERFRFQLTESEYENLRSQIVTSSSNNNYGGRRYLPYAFTEQEIVMLSAVLKETLIKGLTPFNSVSLLFLNVQYNRVEFWTFNFAAEIARLVKLTSFENLAVLCFSKHCLLYRRFAFSRNDENSALS